LVTDHQTSALICSDQRENQMDSLAQQLVPANYVNDLKEQSPKALETLTLMKVIKCYFCYLLLLTLEGPFATVTVILPLSSSPS